MADASGDTRLPTGIDALDRELQGGLPSGSVVAFTAPPASQSELLLYELTNTRSTLYLTAARTEEAVAYAIERARCPTGDPKVQFVPGDAPLENARRLFRSLGEGANLVIDPADPLERSEPNRYQNFLNDLQNHMRNTGSLAILHCLRGSDVPSLRSTTEHMADVVFDLQQRYDGRDGVTRLAVPKVRGGHSPTETVKQGVAARVRVDTSRDIA